MLAAKLGKMHTDPGSSCNPERWKRNPRAMSTHPSLLFLAKLHPTLGTVPLDPSAGSLRQANALPVEPLLGTLHRVIPLATCRSSVGNWGKSYLVVIAPNHLAPTDISAEAISRLVGIDIVSPRLLFSSRRLFLRFCCVLLALGRSLRCTGGCRTTFLPRCVLALAHAQRRSAIILCRRDGSGDRPFTASAGCCHHRCRRSSLCGGGTFATKMITF